MLTGDVVVHRLTNVIGYAAENEGETSPLMLITPSGLDVDLLKADATDHQAGHHLGTLLRNAMEGHAREVGLAALDLRTDVPGRGRKTMMTMADVATINHLHHESAWTMIDVFGFHLLVSVRLSSHSLLFTFVRSPHPPDYGCQTRRTEAWTLHECK